MDIQEKLNNPNPREKANPLSKLFLWWLIPLFRKGAKENLVVDDVYNVLQEDVAENLGNKLSRAWKEEIRKSKMKQSRPRFYRSLTATFGPEFILTGLFLAVNEWIFRVFQVMCLKWLIQSFSASEENTNEDNVLDQYLYAGGICLTSILNLIIFHPTLFWIQHLGMKMRLSSCSLIYRKALRISKATGEQASIGHLINLCSNNVSRFDYNLIHLHYYYIGPVQAGIFTYLLWDEFGVSCLAGTGFVILLTPLQYYMSQMFTTYGDKIAAQTDKRGSVMNEIIVAIRVIKMYGWEKPFGQIIEQIRRMEVQILRKSAYLRAIDLSLFISTAKIISFLTFLTYILIDPSHVLSSDKVFFAVAAYNVMRQIMISYVPTAVAETSELFVSINRIEKFLLMEEQSCTTNTHQLIEESSENGLSTGVIKMDKACARWTGDKLTLDNLDVSLDKNQLVIVCGGVGSGKTSYLHALLGELPITSGTCLVRGKTAYASQEPWIFSGNVRQNILFGRAYSADRYKEIVKSCALEDDFKQLPFGDRSIVGERGVSLSGGQKARVNLARALYGSANIYLLDDPLSAVDSRVSRHLFEKCIKKDLKSALRILVTHQLQYLPQADHILVLSEGKIVESGTYYELVEKGVNFGSIISTETVSEEVAIKRRQSIALQAETERLIASKEVIEEEQKHPENQNEKSMVGSVNWKLYRDYFRAGNSPIGLLTLVIGFICTQVLFSGSEIWLSRWTNEEEETAGDGGNNHVPGNDEREFQMTVYSSILIFIFFLTTVTAFYFFYFCMKISINMHNKMFTSIVKAPTLFYDQNTSGRIMNRFTKDLGSMDDRLPIAFYEFLSILFLMIGAMVVVVISNYYMIFPTLVMIIAFWFMRRFYIPTSRDVKRIESVARSPLFTHLAATLEGLTTIRSSNSEQILIQQFDALQDLHSGPWYIYVSANRWFAIWLEMISVVFLIIVTLGFLLSTGTMGGSLGLAISSVLSLSGTLQWGMRQSAETENLMTSVERAIEYSRLTPEAELESKPDKKPPKDWPTNGDIEFRNVSLAYSPEKFVLRNLTFDIRGKEKIGIVGRTGAGKSSIISALFRMTEPTGEIIIDGIHVNEIGLHDLRKNISIIPQEPALFSGTIRYNLDPIDEFKDSQLWEVITEVDLKSEIPSLDFKVADGGANFSVGQRQLVCLARAMLRRNCVIVMDEATANVDPRTDNLIQKTIRQKFADCTIITIAHRLNSVMDCDRILVLDHGILVEYDHPHVLLQNPNGILTSMIGHLGKGNRHLLHGVAAETFTGRRGSFAVENLNVLNLESNRSINESMQSIQISNRLKVYAQCFV